MQRNMVQCTEWQTEPDSAVAPTIILDNLEATVATLIKMPERGARGAKATMIIKTLAPAVVELNPVKTSDNGTIPGAVLVALKA